MKGSIFNVAAGRAAAWLALTTALAISARGDVAPTPTYEGDIKPLLARRCTACHSRKNQAKVDVSAGLALDSYEAAMAGTADHKVFDVGKAGESALFLRLVDPDEDSRMPLAEEPLPEPERTLVRRWIDAGAPRGNAPVGAQSPSPGPAGSGRPATARRIVRTLDVVLPIEAKAPTGLEGVGPGTPLQLAIKVGPLPPVTALAFRPDGGQLAVGTFGAVVVWDREGEEPALILDDVPGQVHALAFRPDGRQLAVGAGLPARTGPSPRPR
jgi:hypothetical protein